MTNFIIFLKTVSYLKISQIYYLVKRFFKVTNKVSSITFKKPITVPGWVNFSLYKRSIDNTRSVKFLNVYKVLEFPTDWNSDNHEKLWLYNLHYFNDFCADNNAQDLIFLKKILSEWVEDNPYPDGVGWEPYPVSIRLVNVFKSILGGEKFDDKIYQSLYLQSKHLFLNQEKHLLGNHFFSNLKAILFAGIIFKDRNWINYSIGHLGTQIDEQINADGGNFELSPMYHALMLVDLLDIYNLIKAYDKKILTLQLHQLENKIFKMMNFYLSMLHMDDELSFFNDSYFGLAPEKQKILDYAKKLDLKVNESNDYVINYKDSGYVSVKKEHYKFIFDAADVGASYIPGHAHADTLSFEFSNLGERVFVNSGTSSYLNSNLRAFQRSTKAHNTLELNNKNSTKVWHSFRVADRAKIINRLVEKKNEKIYLSASHDGYKTLFGGNIHQRNIVIHKSKIILEDKIYGRYKTAISRIYLHPDIDCFTKDGLIKLKAKKAIYTISSTSNLDFKILNAFWYPEMGKKLSTKLIEFNVHEGKNNIEITWDEIV